MVFFNFFHLVNLKGNIMDVYGMYGSPFPPPQNYENLW